MANKIVNITAAALSALYFIIQLCLIPSWRKRVTKKSGSLILKTVSPKNSKNIAAFILCWALVFFSLITRTSIFLCCLMCAVSCLACYIAAKETVYAKLNGIYENGLIGSGRFIPFEKIQAFQNVSWNKPETQNTNSLAIQLKTEKQQDGGIVFIEFESSAEYCTVIQTLKQLKLNKPKTTGSTS